MYIIINNKRAIEVKSNLFRVVGKIPSTLSIAYKTETTLPVVDMFDFLFVVERYISRFSEQIAEKDAENYREYQNELSGVD